MQDEVGDRAYDIQSEKEEVKKLKQREREIRGIPESIRDIIINDYEPRNDFTQAEIKELLRIKRRCDSLYDESYRQAISDFSNCSWSRSWNLGRDRLKCCRSRPLWGKDGRKFHIYVL